MSEHLRSVVNIIKSNTNFIVTAHETPDGDAIGSEMAFFLALRKIGKNCRIFNADAMPHYYDFIDPENDITVLEAENQITIDLHDYILIILDTNDINNIGQIRDIILPQVKTYAIIDHHHQNEEIDLDNCIVEEASSTCEILFDIFKIINVTLDTDIAKALFMGIVYDTGSFIYPKTSAKTFNIAYELVKTGVDPNFIYQKMYESNSISSLILQSKVLATLELEFDKHVAIQTMLQETIIECGASYEEAATFINIPLKSERVKVSIFFKENEEGVLRCSMRSKGNINVAEIAQLFGGGGHKTAAGFKCKESLEIIRRKVLQMLEKYFT